ncbi:MAG: hypothetical protein HC924_16205 [Synechococcaceae cyanobacterium SM2_3_2]|nr:hypothetical protein [Synechococcaceae cyanobacterium SM2_3_2]
MTVTLSSRSSGPKTPFPVALWGVGLAALVGVVSLQYQAIEAVKTPDPRQDLLARQQGISLASALGPLGFGNLGSGWLWLEMIQYYGHPDRGVTGYTLAYPYLNTITSLDPSFFLAYRYAPAVLAFTAGEPENALALLQKGTEVITPDVNPRAYLLQLDQAGINFLLLGDSEAGRAAYHAGADWYEAVPEHEGNGDNWRALGDRLVDRPNSRRVRFDVWLSLYRTTADPDTRERILGELAGLGTVRQNDNGELEILPPPD